MVLLFLYLIGRYVFSLPKKINMLSIWVFDATACFLLHPLHKFINPINIEKNAISFILIDNYTHLLSCLSFLCVKMNYWCLKLINNITYQCLKLHLILTINNIGNTQILYNILTWLTKWYMLLYRH